MSDLSQFTRCPGCGCSEENLTVVQCLRCKAYFHDKPGCQSTKRPMGGCPKCHADHYEVVGGIGKYWVEYPLWRG